MSFLLSALLVHSSDSKKDFASQFFQHRMVHEMINYKKYPGFRKLNEALVEQNLLSSINAALRWEDGLWDDDTGEYHVCNWKGVLCTDANIVIEIHWEGQIQVREIDLQWLPSTVLSVTISNQREAQMADLNTRLLPKGLRRLAMYRTPLHGSIDMPSLPRSMEILVCNETFVSGDIVLINLPAALQKICLSRNRISRIVVDNQPLPKSLKSIEIDCTEDFPLQVKKIGKIKGDSIIKVRRFGRNGVYLGTLTI